jgi:parallel beta-helix repeat protein
MGGNSRLAIASPEVTWIKISNKGSPQYDILVDGGQMDINGVKITSWDPDENSVVYQDASGSIPRPYIAYDDAKGGGIIQNSELAYMGYNGGIHRGFSIIGESADIELRNNDFHHWWYAFYSNGAENVTIDGNKFHDNYKYAIDPHSGTRDMKITNNHVYNNTGTGIICSEDCANILIEANLVHNNPKVGIHLSKNMHDSIVRNNLIYNSDRGISFNGSPDNEIYNNTIRNVTVGLHITQPIDDISIGPSDGNKIYNNTFQNATIGAESLRDNDNTFSNNNFVNSKSHDFYVHGGSEIKIENQTFRDYKIIGDSGRITIQNSGTIEINGKTLDTDNDDGAASFSRNLDGNNTITINSK